MAAPFPTGKEKRDLIDIAIPMLQDPSGFVRARTAHAMGFIGPDAKDADIYLIHLLKDPDNNVRKDAEWALGEINTPDAKRALRYEIQKYF
jgi:HEAT repeat protein